MTITSMTRIVLGLLALCTRNATAQKTRFLPQEEQWEKARLLWQSAKPQKYSFEYEKLGAPDAPNTVYPWYVTVEMGKTPTAKDGNHNDILWATPKSINQFFMGIKEQLDRNTARIIDVQYNTRLGYPERIYISLANGQVYDVEIDNLKDLQQIAPPTTNRQGYKLSELNKAEERWNTMDIEDYQFQYKELGSNPYNIVFPLSINVRNDDEISGKDGNGNPILWKTPSLKTFQIESLFDRVRMALRTNAKYVEVRYNKVYGYPEDIYIVVDDRSPDSTFDAELYNFAINRNV